MTRFAVLFALALLLTGCAANSQPPSRPAPTRLPEKAGWIQVTLSGSPHEIGFQHGSLLAPEILDAKKAIQYEVEHDTNKPWAFFRDAARDIFWPKVDEEYRQELQGIADGLKSKGVSLDVWDVTAMNGWMELTDYYVPQYDKQHGIKTPGSVTAPDHCSAFVATGSYTKAGKVVMAHNAWVEYVIGERWNIVFDINPERGHRVFMDGFPGLIHSGDDFAINDAGIMITETTISAFSGFDAKGIPEFVRARKAAQYAESLDGFASIMKEGNNGGYANNWLVADSRTGEIGSLELGLKNVVFQKKSDGYFAGANYPVDETLIKEETDFDPQNKGNSSCARRVRWTQLLEQNKGKIDVAMAREFLADDVDPITGKHDPSERSLCGRVDLSSRGMMPWQHAYGPAGAVQNKAADADLAQRLAFMAAYGPLAGPPFEAEPFLKKHEEYGWLRPLLRDMPAKPWTLFEAAK
jgi:hypothetical protein